MNPTDRRDSTMLAVCVLILLGALVVGAALKTCRSDAYRGTSDAARDGAR